jgi:hypothetical protein
VDEINLVDRYDDYKITISIEREGAGYMVDESIDIAKERSMNRRKAGEVYSVTTETVSKDYFAYEIRLKNHLDLHWSEWFDGWTITNVGNDEVVLTCSCADHAGLHGVLDKIRDLNLTLIFVKRISPDSPGSE